MAYTLTRVFHRADESETAKANEYARKERMKSCVKYNGVTNAQYAKQDAFVKACENAGVTPTARQASKYRRGFGKVKRTQLEQRYG